MTLLGEDINIQRRHKNRKKQLQYIKYNLDGRKSIANIAIDVP